MAGIGGLGILALLGQGASGYTAQQNQNYNNANTQANTATTQNSLQQSNAVNNLLGQAAQFAGGGGDSGGLGALSNAPQVPDASDLTQGNVSVAPGSSSYNTSSVPQIQGPQSPGNISPQQSSGGDSGGGGLDSLLKGQNISDTSPFTVIPQSATGGAPSLIPPMAPQQAQSQQPMAARGAGMQLGQGNTNPYQPIAPMRQPQQRQQGGQQQGGPNLQKMFQYISSLPNGTPGKGAALQQLLPLMLKSEQQQQMDLYKTQLLAQMAPLRAAQTQRALRAPAGKATKDPTTEELKTEYTQAESDYRSALNSGDKKTIAASAAARDNAKAAYQGRSSQSKSSNANSKGVALPDNLKMMPEGGSIKDKNGQTYLRQGNQLIPQ